MSEIARCPICGEVPKLIFYPPGEEVFRHCGVEITHRKTWNQYAAAMELVKRHKDLDNYKGVNPNIITDLVNAITVAEHNVLEVFK